MNRIADFLPAVSATPPRSGTPGPSGVAIQVVEADGVLVADVASVMHQFVRGLRAGVRELKAEGHAPASIRDSMRRVYADATRDDPAAPLVLATLDRALDLELGPERPDLPAI